MFAKILGDKDLLPFFSQVDKEALKQKQKSFFVYITGGSATWVGKPMVATQKVHGFRPEHFDKVMKHTIDTLREMGTETQLV